MILIQDRCKFIMKMNEAKELLCHFIRQSQRDWMFINGDSVDSKVWRNLRMFTTRDVSELHARGKFSGAFC